MNHASHRPVLLAGAAGHLGAEILRKLSDSGVPFRLSTRDPSRLARSAAIGADIIQCDLRRDGDAEKAVRGVSAVISCVGASLDLRAFRDRASYASVDHELNLRLLDAALAAGVERYVYVSVFSTPELSRTAYVRAHERFAAELAKRDIRSVIIRPTGFFYSYVEMLRMADRGRGIVIGSGEARTNPIHEADVAHECVRALTCSESVIDAGGPEVLTRRDIQRLAFQVLGRAPRITRVPAAPFLTGAFVTRVFHRRLGELLEFGTVASTVDIVAPERGRLRLEDYYRDAAPHSGGRQPTPPLRGSV